MTALAVSSRRARSLSCRRLSASSSDAGSSRSGRSTRSAEVSSVNSRLKADEPVTEVSVSTRSSGSESWCGR